MPITPSARIAALVLAAALGACASPTQHDEAWTRVASPTLDYRPDASPGAKAFAALVPDPQAYLHDIARKVARTLYKNPADVPAFSTLELRIERWENEPKGIAWKAGEPPRITVNVNAYYLEKYAADGGNVAEEVRGILFHEMTHAYQHYTGMAPQAIEGVADLVRYKAGYQPPRHRKTGGSFKDGYKTTSFFFAWLEEHKGFRDFGICFNASASPNGPASGQVTPWSWEAATAACTAGGRIDELWSEYQVWVAQNPSQTQR
ncbi:MAG: basic secretory protein-like protein [Roseateles asaccharophilus]|uniref:Basic secretory peptidase family protein n=1 Tax=Roseateles asaccharophilus TaxID=582607 RepID=A0A4R6N1A7_9BURK|nr:basic secretory protein-like protein [Roseateles asaccharophilus]MDN3545396.1 basic secretory protein-like protein [Roseateles asaccharophilus]TDP07776.1 basic secretory peptidase family protein [Roseateles asaccharophilus]